MTVASSRQEGLALVGQLVDRYRNNQDHYESSNFDEASTRAQFVDRLFQALGWDVLDEAGQGPDRDVRFHPSQTVEPSVAGEASWDADLEAEELEDRAVRLQIPDYSFRLDGATQMLVEAKRAGVNLDTPATPFQIKTYGWSSQVPVGVACNFRQLRVYDCRYEPVHDEPDKGIVSGLRLGFEDYQQAWDLLWSKLSRPAVEAGSLMELLGETSRVGRRVDRAFLKQLRDWRELLAQDLLDHNPDLDAYEIGEATQKILDRLVFMRTCEDRRIEPKVILRSYARRTDTYRHLTTRFRQLDGAYNGALFREHFVDRLSVSDHVIQQIIAQLYPPRSPYVFDAIATDVLGTIYERFLGQEVTIRNSHVELENKPEVRHAGGVYYTPRWVVDQIVADCLDPLLEGRTPRTARNLRIVDPACGSGSFLLGVLDYLIEWHERYYTANPDESPDRHYETEDGQRKLKSDAKANLLSRSIYGVDIDPQAVEVTQLALYLKVLEGESSSTLTSQLRLLPGALLPPLQANFRCGNSLLGTGDLDLNLLDTEERRRRINPFDWRSHEYGFGQVFEERGGFDVVLGNPPYTRVQTLHRYRPEETERYADLYEAASVGSFDIASLFVERGLELLRPTGRLAFIISKRWASNDAGRPLRDLLRAGALDKIYDFGAGQVFEDASVYTMILEATASTNRSFELLRTPEPTPQGIERAADPASSLHARVPLSELGSGAWPLTLPAEQELVDRLVDAFPTLEEVSGDSIFQGPVTGADKIFRSDDVGPHPEDPALRLVDPHLARSDDEPVALESELLYPVLAGKRDLGRFFVDETTEWLLLPYRPDREGTYQLIPPERLQVEYPHAHRWLSQNRDALEDRAGSWGPTDWYGYSGRKNLEKYTDPAGKVLVPYMVRDLCAAWDPDGHFFVNVTTGGYGVEVIDERIDAPRYVAALLNSHLLSYLLRLHAEDFRGGWVGARKAHLSRLPVAIPDPATQQEILEAYDRCRQAVADLRAARSGSAQHEQTRRLAAAAIEQFDSTVFDLYELTAQERDLVRSQPPREVA